VAHHLTVLEKLGSHVEEIYLGPCFTTFHKINFRWIKELDGKNKTTNVNFRI
jgi:hypothetical protein